MGIAVANALAAAHELGIVHRDVKPGNVLLNHHGRVKLGDFGIAHLLGGQSVTHTDAVAFTPEHVAPEILPRRAGRAVERRLRPRVDVGDSAHRDASVRSPARRASRRVPVPQTHRVARRTPGIGTAGARRSRSREHSIRNRRGGHRCTSFVSSSPQPPRHCPASSRHGHPSDHRSPRRPSASPGLRQRPSADRKPAGPLPRRPAADHALVVCGWRSRQRRRQW